MTTANTKAISSPERPAIIWPPNNSNPLNSPNKSAVFTPFINLF